MPVTREGANNLLALMKANYSYAFKGLTRDDKILLVNSWTVAMSDLDDDIVAMACIQLLNKSKWMPTIAEIREQVGHLHYEADQDIRFIRQMAEFQRRIDGSEISTEEQARIAKLQDIRGRTMAFSHDKLPEVSIESMLGNPLYTALMPGGAAGQRIEQPALHLEDTSLH